MKYVKEHKSIFIVAGIAVLLLGFFSVSNLAAMNKTESNIVKAEAAQTMNEDMQPSEVSAACAKALYEEMPDCPLLAESVKGEFAGYGDSCLENAVNDVNAISDEDAEHAAKNVIMKVCEKNGIDARTAKVKDLTKQQITEIDEEVFQYSKHGK